MKLNTIIELDSTFVCRQVTKIKVKYLRIINGRYIVRDTI